MRLAVLTCTFQKAFERYSVGMMWTGRIMRWRDLTACGVRWLGKGSALIGWVLGKGSALMMACNKMASGQWRGSSGGQQAPVVVPQSHTTRDPVATPGCAAAPATQPNDPPCRRCELAPRKVGKGCMGRGPRQERAFSCCLVGYCTGRNTYAQRYMFWCKLVLGHITALRSECNTLESGETLNH